ncbi:MAG: hypothetical protein WC750_01095 [Patescibacteria group bacterium]
MPERIKNILLDEDLSLGNKYRLEKVKFPKSLGILGKIRGMDILAGLQKLHKPGHLTVFRAIRFPTNKRIFKAIFENGCALPNFEQERILELYHDPKYVQKRKGIQKDRNFWVQPQERVVNGLPVFHLVNDAIQIHHAFRHERDRVLVIALYLPYALLKNKNIHLISNSAIDLNYSDQSRDFEIQDFVFDGQRVQVALEPLMARGIDLHEMFIKNLPWDIKGCDRFGIKQDYYLLDIHRIKDDKKIKKLRSDTKILLKNNNFLHGFFGDQNVFARRASKYLPFACFKIER